MGLREHFEQLRQEDLNKARKLRDSSTKSIDLAERSKGYVKQAKSYLKEAGVIDLMTELEQYIHDSSLTIIPEDGHEDQFVAKHSLGPANSVFAGIRLRWDFASHGGSGEDGGLALSHTWTEFEIVANAGRKTLKAILSHSSTHLDRRFFDDQWMDDDIEQRRLFEHTFSELEWRDKENLTRALTEVLYNNGVRLSSTSKDEIRKETEDMLLKAKRRLEDSGFLELVRKVRKLRPHSKMHEYRRHAGSFTVVLQWDALYLDDSGEWLYTGNVERTWDTYYQLEATAPRGDVLLVKCFLAGPYKNVTGPKPSKTFIEETFHRDDWQDNEKFEQTLTAVLLQTGVRLPIEGS